MTTEPQQHPDASAARWALLAGNFAIGCGVMVTAGSLNDLVHSLQVSVPVGGQLISLGALTMAIGAPVLAAAVAGWDRRRLLVLALLWYAAGHLLSALAPNFAALLPLRAASMIGAAVFTPQAAAAINVMVPAHERGRAFAFIFLGWSLASVIGMPLNSFIGETFGWRWAFVLIAGLSLASAVGVWRSVPDGIKPPPMNLASWRSTLGSLPLMGVVLVTALSAAGQFTLFAYLAPYYQRVLGASPAQVSLLFLCFGAFGLAGNLLLTRWIDRLGASRCVGITLAAMALSMLLWPLAGSLAVMVLVMALSAGVELHRRREQRRLLHA